MLNVKFAQLNGNIVHYIHNVEEKPKLHPSIPLVDITGNDEVKERWVYNPETGEFSEPNYKPIEEPQLTQPTIENIAEENLLETKYQTLLLEMML